MAPVFDYGVGRTLKAAKGDDSIGKFIIVLLCTAVIGLVGGISLSACGNAEMVSAKTPAVVEAAAPSGPNGQSDLDILAEKGKAHITRQNPKVIETMTIYTIYVTEPDGSIGVYNAKHWKFYGDSEYFKFQLIDDQGVMLQEAKNPLRFPVRAFLKMEQHEITKVKYYEKVEIQETKTRVEYKEVKEWIYEKTKMPVTSPDEEGWTQELTYYRDLNMWKVVAIEKDNFPHFTVERYLNGKWERKTVGVEDHLKDYGGEGYYDSFQVWMRWMKSIDVGDFIYDDTPFQSGN